jgi:hypothetical protein
MSGTEFARTNTINGLRASAVALCLQCVWTHRNFLMVKVVGTLAMPPATQPLELILPFYLECLLAKTLKAVSQVDALVQRELNQHKNLLDGQYVTSGDFRRR